MKAVLTEQDIDKIINMLVKIKMEHEYKYDQESYQRSNSREHNVYNNNSKEHLKNKSNLILSPIKTCNKDLNDKSNNDSE